MLWQMFKYIGHKILRKNTLKSIDVLIHIVVRLLSPLFVCMKSFLFVEGE